MDLTLQATFTFGILAHFISSEVVKEMAGGRYFVKEMTVYQNV